MITLLTATDLHRSAGLLKQLQKAVLRHKPNVVALVGDFLHAFDDDDKRVTSASCAALLSQLPCPEIVLVRGNHEDEAWYVFADAWKNSGRPLHALHGEAFSHGPLTVLGFPCLMGDETAFIGDRPPLPVLSEEWLPAVMRKAGPAGRAIWLMHEPPTGTPLSNANSVVAGNPDWITAIEQFSPWLSISGHDHLTPIKRNCWYHRVGQTTCANAGQTDHGPLHYCVVEAEFTGSQPCLPSAIRVTAFPWAQTISLPPKA